MSDNQQRKVVWLAEESWECLELIKYTNNDTIVGQLWFIENRKAIFKRSIGNRSIDQPAVMLDGQNQYLVFTTAYWPQLRRKADSLHRFQWELIVTFLDKVLIVWQCFTFQWRFRTIPITSNTKCHTRSCIHERTFMIWEGVVGTFSHTLWSITYRCL